MSDHYDILIVGAGLVGASLALSLTNTSLRVAVCEAATFAMPPPANAATTATPHSLTNNKTIDKTTADKTTASDGRSLALTYGSAQLLTSIGVWPSLQADAIPIASVHVSHRNHFGATRINASEERVPALGYVIPAQVLGTQLQQALLANKSLTLFNPVKVQSLTRVAQGWQVTLANDQTPLKEITADLVVAADGSHSMLRQLLAIETEQHDYEQSAIATTIQLSRPHQQIAYERFVDDGAIAMLPRAGLNCGHIWTAPRAKIAELMALTDGDYLQHVQTYFGFRLGHLLAIGKRYTYPLQMIHARQPVRQGFVLIGNAAHTIHPIAAQGFNLGLADVAVLTQAITEAIHNDKNPGDLAVLQGYVQQREQAQQEIMRFTNSLTSLFTQDFLPLNLARTAGLLALDLFSPLKHKLAQRLMGMQS